MHAKMYFRLSCIFIAQYVNCNEKKCFIELMCINNKITIFTEMVHEFK